ASVFESLWERAAGGGFDADDLSDRDDLWRLLCHMLRRKVTDHRRKDFTAKRGGGAVRGESVFGTRDGENVAGLDALAETAFTPDELAEFAERHEQLMAALGDDVLAEVATLRLEGYEVTEIAARLGVSARTVKRKLALIRETWREVGDLPSDP
ncbi:MAG TPA: ECF-type sigma factor, partial [Planctomycetaceae bacterium]